MGRLEAVNITLNVHLRDDIEQAVHDAMWLNFGPYYCTDPEKHRHDDPSIFNGLVAEVVIQ